MKSSITTIDGRESVVTVFHDGEIFTAVVDQHPNFAGIVKALKDDPHGTTVIDMFDVERVVRREFERLSERVTVVNGEVQFDNAALHNAVAGQIMRFIEEGLVDRLEATVNFVEKVMANPQEHSRDQLFDWLERHNFSITPSGDIVAYKGVTTDLLSTRQAPARENVTVDGQPVEGYVPNQPGSVVEMDRTKVAHNPSEACSSGLHVGTYDYARSFAAVCLEVHVNPRDVVSVPTDCNSQKVRTSRYTVIGPVENAYASALVAPVEDDEDDEEFSCVECGEELCCELDSGLCDDCFYEQDDEDSAEAEDEDDTEVVSVTVTWDTRQNYTKQERYPAGHPKAGQFKPRV